MASQQLLKPFETASDADFHDDTEHERNIARKLILDDHDAHMMALKPEPFWPAPATDASSSSSIPESALAATQYSNGINRRRIQAFPSFNDASVKAHSNASASSSTFYDNKSSRARNSGLMLTVPKRPQDLVRNREVIGSLPLQQLMFFNIYLSVVQFFTMCFVLNWKRLNFGSNVFAVYITPTIFSVWVFFEIIRFYAGYAGNLQEQSPHLTAFAFLTIVPAIAAQIYFCLIQQPLLVYDCIFSIIQLVFLILEFIFSISQIIRLTAFKTARFGIEYSRLEDGDDIDHRVHEDFLQRHSSDLPVSTAITARRDPLQTGLSFNFDQNQMHSASDVSLIRPHGTSEKGPSDTQHAESQFQNPFAPLNISPATNQQLHAPRHTYRTKNNFE